MINKFVNNWRWLFAPYQTQESADFYVGISITHSILIECQEYKNAFFTSDMIWGELLKRYPNLKKEHVARGIEVHVNANVVHEVGVVRQGASDLKILKNA